MKDETDAVCETAPAEMEAPQKSSYLARAIGLSTAASGLFGIPPLIFDIILRRKQRDGSWLH